MSSALRGLAFFMTLLLFASCTDDEPISRSTPPAAITTVSPLPTSTVAVAQPEPVTPHPTAVPDENFAEPEPVESNLFVTAKPEAGSFHVEARSQVVPVYEQPGGEPRMLVYSNEFLGELRYPLFNPRRSGEPLVLRVIEGAEGDEWIKVQAPVRPTRLSVWVRAADFDFGRTELRLEVDIAGEGRFSLFDGDDEIVTNPIVSGRDSRPTTLTDTYVDQVIDTDNYASSPAYGPYVITWATFSDVLSTFGGGKLPSQGVHGTNQPELMGQQVSSGKIRLPNEIVAFVAEYSDELLGASVVVFDSTGIGSGFAIERLKGQPWTAATTVDPESPTLKIGEPIF